MAANPMVQNRSMLKDFIGSVMTMSGDLSNITAPPFVLDTKSAVELPAFLAERPSVFVAPAAEEDPEKRALLVLRWFLSSLRGQQYSGRDPAEGAKKPLNSFLGEVLLAEWNDDAGKTRLVSEQVSHHPPVTACRIWNEQHGISAQGFTRQEMTFSGSAYIKQTGYAVLHIEKYNESYLMPMPSIKVKNVLTGIPYPELEGTYYIPSTSGYISKVEFSGEGWFGSGERHGLNAKIFKHDDPSTTLYTASGTWVNAFTFEDKSGKVIETFTQDKMKLTPLEVDPIEEQDPWESQRAWKEVKEALQQGDMQGTSDAKNRVEQGQRELRKEEDDDDGKDWKRMFFTAEQEDPVAARLQEMIDEYFDPEETVAIWKFNTEKWKDGIKRPLRDFLAPDNTRLSESDARKVSTVELGGAAESDSDSGEKDRSSSYGPNLSGNTTIDESVAASKAMTIPTGASTKPAGETAVQGQQSSISSMFSFRSLTAMLPESLRPKDETQGNITPSGPSSQIQSESIQKEQPHPAPVPKDQLLATQQSTPKQHLIPRRSTESPVAVVEVPSKTDDPNEPIPIKGSALPPIPDHIQQQERDAAAESDSGIDGMTTTQKDNVEQMLRNVYSSQGKK